MGRPTAQFCKRGHDTYEAGRFSNGWCRACSADETRIHRPTGRGKGNWGDKPSRHPIEWERRRVKGWVKITTADPITSEHNGTQARAKAFATRYERLEAAVPTPETVDA